MTGAVLGLFAGVARKAFTELLGRGFIAVSLCFLCDNSNTR
jgi:hypothetical protein